MTSRELVANTLELRAPAKVPRQFRTLPWAEGAVLETWDEPV